MMIPPVTYSYFAKHVLCHTQVHCRCIPEHKPGGISGKPTKDLVDMTKSVMKHNIYQSLCLVSLISLRDIDPAKLLCQMNHSFYTPTTRLGNGWRRSEEERDKIISESKKRGTNNIQMKKEEQLVQKRGQLKMLEMGTLQREESLTNLF